MGEQIDQDLIMAELMSFRDSNGDIDECCLGEDWECIEEGDWTQEHKYQSCKMIVKHYASGRHFIIWRNRSGSYYSDWYYSDSAIDEVKQVTKTVVVTEWVAI